MLYGVRNGRQSTAPGRPPTPSGGRKTVNPFNSDDKEHIGEEVKLTNFINMMRGMLPADLEMCMELLDYLPTDEQVQKATISISPNSLIERVTGFANRKKEKMAEDPNEEGNECCARLIDLSRKSMEDDYMEADDSIDEEFVPESEEIPFFPPPSVGSLGQRLFAVLQESEGSICGRITSGFIILVIVASTVTFIMESIPEYREHPAECDELIQNNQSLTVKACEPQPLKVFYVFETICILIFSIEYVARMALVHVGSETPLCTTLVYARKPLNLVDFCAILPFYLELALGDAGSRMRMLRLLRILRLFKLAKHHPGIAMFAKVLEMSGQPLLILVFFTIIIAVLFASLMYYAEGTRFSVDPSITGDYDQPTGVFVRRGWGYDDDEATPFRSIPYALWWVFVTTTTVGYGDYSPTTFLGKLIGVTCFYVGIIFLALPISVLGTNFEILYEAFIIEKEEKAKKMGKVRSLTADEEKKLNLKRRRTTLKIIRTWLPAKELGLKKRIFFFFDDPQSCRMSHKYSLFMLAVILMSTILFVCESMPLFQHTPSACSLTNPRIEDCRPEPAAIFNQIEVACITIFTCDYLARIFTVHAVSPAEASIPPWKPNGFDDSDVKFGLQLTFRYSIQLLNLVDLFAIMPFYIELVLNAMGQGGALSGASVLRVMRLIRVFRVMKMPKLKACTDMFVQVITDTLPALMILFFMTMLMCTLYSSIIYFVEGTDYTVDANLVSTLGLDAKGGYIRPTTMGYAKEPSPFISILYTFWWFFTTATTVGYGDDYPTSTAGRCIGILTFYTGIILLALPVTIVSQAFNKYYPDFVEEFGSTAEKEVFKKNSMGDLVLNLHQTHDKLETMQAVTSLTDCKDQEVICPSCGNVYMPDSAFCRKCGKHRGEANSKSEIGSYTKEANGTSETGISHKVRNISQSLALAIQGKNDNSLPKDKPTGMAPVQVDHELLPNDKE